MDISFFFFCLFINDYNEIACSILQLDDGLELSFTDKRRFAKVRLLEDPASVPPISELGPDALLEPMTIDEFIKSLSKKKIAIKTLLLDQGVDSSNLGDGSSKNICLD
ncbi:Formamidopyrimidine-DNA glycosylase [Vitis vinifera]|uniref:Formamidopyrimidine-DNA glycosylase n=1 Tax=Vitis vinifera TaxID=29760 RepID=A0A438I5Y4_VITVI|nr:Formamidopyrimidine-DNA glycosylase [Vitis vinifera]